MRTFPVENSRARLIAKVLRDLIAHESFASMTELKDALWRRLFRLQIAAAPLDVDDALAMVGSNVRLTTIGPTAPRPLAPARLLPAPPIISRAEAPQVLERLWARLRGRP
jgi:hypothetical protein